MTTIAPHLPDQIEHLPTDTLVPYARNSRTHSPEQVAQIAASIKEFGFTNPVLIDANNTLIAGHGRVMAAQSIGLLTVPAIRLAHLSDAQRRADTLQISRAVVEQALKRAYQLGQTYWQQADSDSWTQNKKSDETQVHFNALVTKTCEALQPQAAAWQTLSQQIQEAAIASGQKQRPRKNNQGIASDAWLHPIGTCSPERNGENQHHEHRAGESDAKCTDCKCDSECTRVSGAGQVRAEQIAQAAAEPTCRPHSPSNPPAKPSSKCKRKGYQMHSKERTFHEG